MNTPDPIFLPIEFGSDKRPVRVTVNVAAARQILALTDLPARLDTLHKSTDEMIVALGQRVAALEAWMVDHRALHKMPQPAQQAQPCPHPASVTDEDGVVRCDQCQAVIWEHKQPAQAQPMPHDSRIVVTNPDAHTLKVQQPAQPDAYEAEQSLYDVMRDKTESGEYVENKRIREFAVAILAAIRKGDVPGIFAVDQCHKADLHPGPLPVSQEYHNRIVTAMNEREAALRARLAEAEQAERVGGRALSNLGQQVEALTRERDRWQREAENHRRDLCEIAEGCGVGVADQEEAKRRIIALRAERDRTLADLENVRASLSDGPGATEAECRRLRDERDRLKDDLAAARAEADALAGLLRDVRNCVPTHAANLNYQDEALRKPFVERIDAALAQHSAGGARVAVKLPAILAAVSCRALDDVYMAGDVHKALRAAGIAVEGEGKP